MAHRRGDSLSAPLLVSLATAAISIVPIRSYDAFWHLATGRWIVDHAALPARDPFGLASSDVVWHNGAWLFQILLYGFHRLGGDATLSLARAVTVGLLAGWLFLQARRESPAAGALILVSVAIYGADARLAVRPEIAGIVLVALVVTLSLGALSRGALVAIAAVVALWINLHPSALLAPVIVGAAAVGRAAAGERTRKDIARFGIAIAAALGALLANPWGWRGIAAPIELARFASGDTFVNTEWLPSHPATFPLLYGAIIAGAALLVRRRDRTLLPRAILFAIFAVLAIRYVRNQGFFFVALPLLLAPAMPRLTARAGAVAAAAAATIVAIALPLRRGIGAGTDPARFPVAAVRQLRSAGLGGHVYNPDQFGGYLIWQFYPERRVLTDGRNELYPEFLRELPRALADSRRWNRLIDRYDLVLAVQEYRSGTIRVMNAVTGSAEQKSPARVYFPESRWALVAFDDVAMVFARRDAFAANVIDRLEYRAIDPERGVATGSAAQARAEVERARRNGADGWRVRRVEEGL